MKIWIMLIAASCFALSFAAYQLAERPVIRRLERLRALGRLPPDAPEDFARTSADLWVLSQKPELVADAPLMKHIARLRFIATFVVLGWMIIFACILAMFVGLL